MGVLVKVSGAVPVFLMVTTFPGEDVPWLMEPKAMGLGVMVMAGKVPVPVRLAETVAALLRMFRPADSRPVVVGVNTADMVQVLAGGSADTQSPVGFADVNWKVPASMVGALSGPE